jgi:hypothetical protein
VLEPALGLAQGLERARELLLASAPVPVMPPGHTR